MVEANHSLQQAQLRANMSTAVRVLARQGRSKRPSERLPQRASSRSISQSREIVAAADKYLAGRAS
jgi:hypothetical protein